RSTREVSFGRLGRCAARGSKIRTLLAKTTAGCNEVLRSALELAHGRRFLIAINERIADGRDVSWLWDVDFEMLRNRAEAVISGGVRANDMAVRLKYAGVEAVEPPEPDAQRAI